MSVISKRRQHADTAPSVRRGSYGSALWPEETREAFYQLCDLARVAPDTRLGPEELHQRLWDHGEGTKLATVLRIYQAMETGKETWR